MSVQSVETTSGIAVFDADARYRLSPAVTLRPEPFGALAYHFGQRRLTYLASAELAAVVGRLDGESTAGQALASAGVAPERQPVLARALANLVHRGVLDAI